MKWVELAKYFPPDAGGIERVSFSTVKAAVSRGFEVVVVAFSSNSASTIERIDSGLIRRWKVQIKKASAPISIGYLVDALKEMREATVVHIHMPNPIAALAVLLSKGNFRLLVHWHSDVVAQKRLYKLYRYLESRILERSDTIIVTSSLYADFSVPLHPWRQKCVEIPLASDFRRVSGEVIKGRVIACGRLVSYKGFDVLVEAMSLVPDSYECFICGNGPLYDMLRQKIEDFQLTARVHMLGFVPDTELADILATGDVFCMPSVSRAEAFGISVIEAFSCGMPVVSSALHGSGLSVINKHGETGLQFKTGDPRALADSLVSICEDRMVRHAMSVAARNEYAEKYTEKSYAERFDQLLNSYI